MKMKAMQVSKWEITLSSGNVITLTDERDAIEVAGMLNSAAKCEEMQKIATERAARIGVLTAEIELRDGRLRLKPKGGKD